MEIWSIRKIVCSTCRCTTADAAATSAQTLLNTQRPESCQTSELQLLQMTDRPRTDLEGMNWTNIYVFVCLNLKYCSLINN